MNSSTAEQWLVKPGVESSNLSSPANYMQMERIATWRRLNGTRLKTSIEEELSFRLTDEVAMDHQLKICIGTDSQVKSGRTEFDTVIVVVRKGKGAFMYIRSEISEKKMSIKERMLTEVGKSIDVAYAVSNLLTLHQVEMEVHADINTSPAFKSHDALKEAMGYITGMGYIFRAKPHAFASSSCANKVVQ